MSNILTGMLESLKLETISQVYSSIAIDAEKHNKTYTDYLTDLASIEIEERRNKTIAKFLKKAQWKNLFPTWTFSKFNCCLFYY